MHLHIGIVSLYFSNQIKAGFQGVLARLPTRRTYFPGMFFHIFRRLHFSKHLFYIPSYAVVMELVRLKISFGINNERAPKRKSFFLNIRAECSAQLAGGIG